MLNRKKLPPAKEFIKTFSRHAVLTGEFIFDFDGTLVNFQEDPDKVFLPPVSRSALKVLVKKLRLPMTILSGRTLKDLSNHFSETEFRLIGEHGGDSNVFKLPTHFDLFEKTEAFNILNRLVKENPGSFIEAKRFSRVFHYRKCIPKISDQTASQWADKINSSLKGSSLVCMNFNQALEIKDASCSKLEVLKTLLPLSPQSRFFCFGDDRSEQEFFDYFSDKIVSVAVGSRIPHSTYQLASPNELGHWLKDLAAEL